MQLLYCDKYVDQGMLGVMHSKPKAGLHPAQSREEVTWGGGVCAHPPSPSGQKQELPSAFPSFANISLPPSLARSICHSHPPPLFHAPNNHEIRTHSYRCASGGSMWPSEWPRGMWLQIGLSTLPDPESFLVAMTVL